MNDESATPMSDETVYAAFLKDLDAATDAKRVIEEYAARYPHLASEMREMARIQGELDESEQHDQSRPEQPARLGDFRIIGAIAEGGMGTIYEAIQDPLNRRVAVKTIRGERQHLTGTLQARFLREQKVLARLHHTHIVPIIAAGRDGALQYFAMSYIDGAALHHVVRTARLHETSSRQQGGHNHPPTPTLAVLAAEAKSSMANGHAKERNGATGNGQPPCAAEATTATLPNVALPAAEPQAMADHPPVPGENGDGKITLSLDYFRSAARVMIDAAEAVQHAHEAGIIHRDLKPSNLMVDTLEHCWVLDFGLAGYLRAQANGQAEPVPSPAAKPTPDLGPDPEQPLVSGVLGTPDYMAPEQFQGRADERTDVWGLGVIFYELLTLRRAFHGKKEIESPSPPPRPRDLVQGLPLDLEAICSKSLQKSPGNRYQAAKAMADDLRHWIKGEPVTARRTHTLRRVALWSRRNPGWAAAITVAALAFTAVSLGTAYAAKREAQTQRREVMLQHMQRIRLTHLRDGWSTEAWDFARKASQIERDPTLQSQAATLLGGLDARRHKSLALPATALAFNPSGNQLLIGGSNWLRKEAERPVQIWDSTTDEIHTVDVKGTGEFGFRADGTSLFLKVASNDESALQLWDVNKARLLLTFKAPGEGRSAIGAWAMTPDGVWVAAAARRVPENRDRPDSGVIAVWEAASGREIFRSAVGRSTDIALSSDGKLLAAGFEDGAISVWSLAEGKPITTLRADRNMIRSLAFGRDPVRRSGPRTVGTGWLLAAGDQGGGVIVWDLTMRVPRSIGHGPTGYPEVLALAFSPDGVTLASAGRDTVDLWDIAAGRPLLEFYVGSDTAALAFSSDGSQVAAGGLAGFTGADSVTSWDLELDRGIAELRGLTRAVFTSTFSPDGRLVAGLANDWRIGIWEHASHRLLHVLEVTPGFMTDNSAFGFSPDGSQFAFASGEEASLWDVATGELTKTWKLFPGLGERLAFAEPNRLLLFRVETETGEHGPFGGTHPVKYPRVYRVRNLLGADPLKPLAEIRDCNLAVFHSECSQRGEYFAIEGLAGPRTKPVRVANLYEGPSGKKLGSLPTQNPADRQYAAFNFDQTASVLNYLYGGPDGERTYFLEMPSRAVMRQFEGIPQCLGPNAKRWLMGSSTGDDQPHLLALHEQDRQEPLVKFLLDTATGRPRFSPDGLHLVWGNPDGTVTVVDLVAVNRRLSELGLGW
jgi:serine/threonine protein kinase/WD40 repeat protein